MPLLIWKVRKGWKGYLSVLRGIIKYVLCSRYMLFWLDIGMDLHIFREKHTSFFYRFLKSGLVIFSVDWLELNCHVSGLISVVCSSMNLILQLQLNLRLSLVVETMLCIFLVFVATYYFFGGPVLMIVCDFKVAAKYSMGQHQWMQLSKSYFSSWVNKFVQKISYKKK